MKKTILLFLVCLICLSFFSCKQDKERIFDYQKDIRSVSLAYTVEDEAYEATLYFEKAEGAVRCRRIEYSAPESLSGVSYTLEGDKITAELSGIRIAYSYFEPEKVFALSRLFCLSEEDICDIKSGNDKTTAAFGKNGNAEWEVVTSTEGIPVRIYYGDKDISGAFDVKKLETHEEDNGTK